jgi:hypothetical protein
VVSEELDQSFDRSGTRLSQRREAAQPLASLCEKSDRWGLVPLRLRGFSMKWEWAIFWPGDKGCGWERDSRFWAFHTGSRWSGPGQLGAIL